MAAGGRPISDAARLIELPFMVLVTWKAAKLDLVFRPVDAWAGRLAVGLTAFVLTLSGEYLIARFGLGRTFSRFIEDFAEPMGALSLAAQSAIIFFPLLVPKSGETA
jgi:hypothetical protein